jgi:hypothetical protein
VSSRRALRRALLAQCRYLSKLPAQSTLPPGLFRAARRLDAHPGQQAARRRQIRRRLFDALNVRRTARGVAPLADPQ